jgi:hypothetical protein
LFLCCLAALAAEPAPTKAPPPPLNHGLLLNIDAYGRSLSGHIVVDTAKLAGQGVTLFTEQLQHEGTYVPLVHGMRVLGLPQGERIIEDAIDSLMYFDANGDKYLDAADPVFPLLMLFVDSNKDLRVQAGEAKTLQSIGVEFISRYGEVKMKER